MYHVILIAIAFTMTLGIWNLVHSSPRSISLLLPPGIAFAAGAFLLVFGAFFSLAAAVLVQNGPAMLAFLLKAQVGFYFLIVRLRDDEDLVRRSFLMLGAMILTIIGIYYVQNTYAAAILMVCLLGTGYYILTTSPRYADPGR